jgi:hypothetical protein
MDAEEYGPEWAGENDPQESQVVGRIDKKDLS